MIPFAVPITWQAADEVFEDSLRRHGVRATSVSDVEAAWRAFVAFTQTELAGAAAADEDGDGFIVQWGRHSWNGNRLALTLTRQLIPTDSGELWQVHLEMAFDDEQELIVAEPGVDVADTEVRFDPIGPQRAAALAEVRDRARQQALVRAMWAATPVSSSLTFERV